MSRTRTWEGVYLNDLRLYKVWLAVLTRCRNPNHIAYHRYGGRGIKVCEEWEKDFTVFHKWCVDNGHEKGLHIDRIDNDGDYSPENCRIVTPLENAKNKSNLINITHEGRTMSVANWSRELNLTRYQTMKKFGIKYKRKRRYNKNND